MLIPSDTANPLNSLLNSGLTLKLSDSLPLTGKLLSPLPSIRLLAKTILLACRPVLDGHVNRRKHTDFCLSCNPESQKYRNGGQGIADA